MNRSNQDEVCSLWFCHAKRYALGMCAKHYQNYRRYGSSLPHGLRDLTEALRIIEQGKEDLAEWVDEQKSCPFCVYDYRKHVHERHCLMNPIPYVGKQLE